MIINDNNKSDNYSGKMQRCVEYIESLEEERIKIQVFQRELPLCLELVSQAIETCRKELYFHGQSECSEQISSEGPVLEEFIPLKRTSSSEEDEQQSKEAKNISKNQSKDSKNSDKSSKKSDWLRSVQLWNQTPDPPTKVDSPRKVSVVEVKKNGNGGAFLPFKREKIVGTAQPAPSAAASSTAETVGSGGGVGGDGCKSENKEDSHRKARRCWSPELHRRFLQALQELGGAHVATPKQIRELMKVDGLTNDEVKSHLQKYRLHTRRPSHSIHSNNNQAPQFVVVGGIWVPPPEYAASGKAAAAPMHPPTNGIYAPKATLPAAALTEATGSSKQRQQSSKQFNSNESGSHSQGRGCSDSPATSSSTHTTRVSPAF